MPHDFERLIDRSLSGSVKYNLMHRADAEVPAGIVPLSIGDMELPTPPELADGLADYIRENVLGYTEATVDDRRAVTEWLRKRHSWMVEPDWIVGCDGVVPALYLAVDTFTRCGDGVVYMPPLYHPIYKAIADSGREPVAVPLIERNGEYVMDFALLERAAAERGVKMLLFCSPHNPVSRVWRRDELEHLGRICLKHDILVVSDEIHMDFVMPGHRHEVFAAIYPEFAAQSIICTAPSKTFNIAGLQVSNIVIPDRKLRERYKAAYMRTGRHEVNQLGLAACRLAYERCGDWLDGVLGLVWRNGQLVREVMNEHFPEVRVFPHEGSYFVWLDFRAWRMDAPDLERFMTRAARLFLDEGYIFGVEGEGFERINVACPEWVLRDALGRLVRARLS